MDTNILISGPKYSEHDQLIELVQSQKISLFNSYHTNIEQHGGVFPARRKRDATLKDLYKSPERFAEFKQADVDYEKALEAEKNELDYWVKGKIYPTMSTFDALVPVYHYGIVTDFKKEMPLFNDLIDTYKLSAGDAFHAMSAHSSEMDYLLTWDQKTFINRCKNVRWLKPKVMTPKDFLLNVRF